MKTFGKILVVVCVLVFGSAVADAEELFSNFEGPAEISLGPIHRYSIELLGEFDIVNCGATGGHVKGDWQEGSRHFCEIQWFESSLEKPAKVTVYAQKKGTDEWVETSLWVVLKQAAKTRSIGYQSLQNGGGKCLEVAAEDLAKDGGKVQIWECNGSIQQQWKIDGLGRLVNEGGKCLDINAPDLHTDGGKVQLWACGDVDQQKWALNEKGAFVSKGGKCLDVNAPDVNVDGGKVQIWECGDVVQQRWKWRAPSAK